ncbi:MAG: T9SS type A sorting domain-containing protein [Vicingaceae bacterium]
MKVVLKIVFLMFWPAVLPGQNLLVNGSFEDTSRHSNGILIANDWSAATSSSPDFFHPFRTGNFTAPISAVGNQPASDGMGYFEFIVYSSYSNEGREYLQGKFSAPLQQDSIYCFQAYISLADSSHYAIKRNLGVYFSNQRVDSSQIQHRLLHLNPQITFDTTTFFTDKQNWVSVKGGVKANGGERYFTIGNFDPDSLLDTLRMPFGGSQFYHYNTYYFIDDVSLVACDSFPGMITSVEEKKLGEKVKLYPNPTKGLIHLALPSNNKQTFNFQLYDLKGRLLRSETVGKFKQIDLSDLPLSLYFYRLSANGELLKTGKLLIKK